MKKKALWKSFWKALIASCLFLLLNLFQGMDTIREEFEDYAFDAVNKFSISTHEQNTASPHITVFSFDNEYMRKTGLFDEEDNPTYGYIFPREKIVQFIEDLDQRLVKNCPKVLLIDIDLSFPAGANQQLSLGDKQLLQTLKQPHCYKILLIKTEANIILLNKVRMKQFND